MTRFEVNGGGMRGVRTDRACAASLALLAGSLLWGAVTKVTLSPFAAPDAADPGVTNVTVIGHNFPSGTIPPANVTVTLTPTTPGGGPTATTAAKQVTVVSGATEQVVFQAPASLVVPTATSYQVSIAGTTSTGNSFTSSNTASLTVYAPVEITTSSPLPAGTAGANYSQTLTATGGSGSYTWSVSEGALPGGLSLNATSGEVAGVPASAGVSYFAVKVTDSLNRSASAGLALTINPPAITKVTLSPSAFPTAADPGVTIVTVVGHNFPSGRILPSNVTVTLGPASIGAGPSGTTAATNITVVSGATEQVTFRVPTSILLPAATPYQISIAGTTSTGNSFASSDTAALVVNAPVAITTSSPLPTGTAGAVYAQALTATGGSGVYAWSVSQGTLPGGLALNPATGGIAGTPTTAGTQYFGVKVTDSLSRSTSAGFQMTVNPTLVITTSSPLPAGTVGVAYSQTLTATGGSGQYTWAVAAGSLPGGLSLNAATGMIGGQPTSAMASNFTIQVTDTNQASVSQPFALTIISPASITSLSPDSSNAGLSLQVTIAGSQTHFSQGTTVASFGPGVAVGGAAAGQPGPVTVTSATSATAAIAIGASAAAGSQTVTVTTGAEQATLANGFTVQAAIPYITVDTSTSVPLAKGFSGFDDEYLINGVEYWDPKYIPFVQALKPGWIRFPSGTPSMAFDWQAGEENASWITQLQPVVISETYQALQKSQLLTEAKCGADFSKYGALLQTAGANGIVAFNGYTDTNANSAGKMVTAAQAAGLNVIEWELANEPFIYPKIYATAADYAAAQYNPYYLDMIAANPAVSAGVFYQGQFIFQSGNYKGWDNGMSAYPNKYWQGVSFHVYPISDSSIGASDEEMTLNGVLAHGTTEYFSSYIQPLIGSEMPVYFTEMNTGAATMPFETSIYNGIFLAEYIARLSTIPQIKAVGVTELYLGNSFTQGMIRAVDDYEAYLLAELQKNPAFCTDTSTNPSTQFSFYMSSSGLAMEVANTAINGSNATWPTTLTGGPTVAILGYDGNPVPAVFAQGYQGSDGTHYVLITNKSSAPVPVAIEVNGSLLEESVTVSYISNASDLAENTATNQNNVQIVTGASANPITVGPYSVTRVQW